jgi:hypothetical protein
VSYFIQIRKSARIKVIIAGRLFAPQLQAPEFIVAYQGPSAPPVPAEVFFHLSHQREQDFGYGDKVDDERDNGDG